MISTKDVQWNMYMEQYTETEEGQKPGFPQFSYPQTFYQSFSGGWLGYLLFPWIKYEYLRNWVTRGIFFRRPIKLNQYFFYKWCLDFQSAVSKIKIHIKFLLSSWKNCSGSRIIISLLASVIGRFAPVSNPHWMQEKSAFIYKSKAASSKIF